MMKARSPGHLGKMEFMSIVEQLNKLSIDTSGKNPAWYPRPKEKCSGDFYVKRTKLLANWFEFSSKITGRMIYEYSVVMYRIVTIRGKEIKKNIPHPSSAMVFWSLIRHGEIPFDGLVFDEYETVWSWRKEDKTRTVNMRNRENGKEVVYQLKISARTAFRLNFSREYPKEEEVVNRSCKFLKCLLTQKFRYSADRDNERQMHSFTNKFLYDRNAIFRIPDYNSDQPKVVIAPNIEAWFGIYLGIRETSTGDPVLNFGAVDRLFYNFEVPEMCIIEYIITITQKGAVSNEIREQILEKLQDNVGMNEAQRKKANQLLNDLKMKCGMVWDEKRKTFVERHLNFIEFSEKTANSYIIHVERNRSISCNQLYQQYDKRLRYPKLPLIKCKTGKSVVELPMELVFVHEKPQRFKKALDFNMKMQFVRAATRDPHVHKKMTEDMLSKFQFDSPDFNFLRSFDISPSLQMIECPGKVLKEAKLVNGMNEAIKMLPTVRGFQEKKLNVVPQGELCIALIVLKSDDVESSSFTDDEMIKEFYGKLIDACAERGLKVGEHENKSKRSLWRVYNKVSCFDGSNCFRYAAQDALMNFEQLEGKENKTLLLLVISHHSFAVYGHVKQVCDTELGVASQVVNADTVKKATFNTSMRICYNIALKINAKLGGVNQEIEYSESCMTLEQKEQRREEPLTMFVGIDVTHPPPESGIDFSIASIVASINAGGTRYRDEVVAQVEKQPRSTLKEKTKSWPPPVKERTDIIENKFVKLLQLFVENNENRLPDKIVIFRDGVSDSELLPTTYAELHSLKKEVQKCMERYMGSVEPKYTYIVIQKRHSTRFYKMSDDKDDLKKSENTGIVNVDSGTVVDKVVVSPYKFDFWLASHHGELGTSRPGHYTVMYDESEMTKDECYKMCYGLCFLSSRCRKPISLPAPVHYAHLSCEKAKEKYKALKDERAEPVRGRMQIEKTLQPSPKYPGMSFV